MSLSLLVPKRLPPNTPYTPALPLAVPIPPDGLEKGDTYIDDSIFITPDINNNNECVAKAIPLAFHTVAWPLSQDNPYQEKC
jgi:hypothetical protein